MEKVKSLSTLNTGQQPLGNLHSSPTNTVRAPKALSETEVTRGLGTMSQVGKGHKIYKSLYSGDDLGNTTKLFNCLILCKAKMPAS